MKDHCWICDNWRPMRFELTEYKSIERELLPEDTVFLHLEFYKYSSILMEHNECNGFWVETMVPPSKFTYFYTINHNDEVAADQPVWHRSKIINYSVVDES